LLGTLKKERLLGRKESRWEYNIEMDLREVGYENVDWIRLSEG
jgi:hypothetical protein